MGALVYFVFIPITILLVPRHTRLPENNRTLKGVRLAVTSFFVSLSLFLLGPFLIGGTIDTISDPKNSPESMIIAPIFLIFIVFVYIMIGPITFAFTCFIPAIADAINWPIEQLIKHGNKS